eukprot:TRINITY_DN27254_c0_g2_i1.p1 TRINITY_DN27254_c0_g2~~TRINITY_DN27254_c0_g2_i1.p1  ORF type:complete len:598 (-),score=38.96 TRINITY_DN27254_c0_g2_i1:260-2053(-)
MRVAFASRDKAMDSSSMALPLHDPSHLPPARKKLSLNGTNCLTRILEHLFRIDERGSTISAELLGGVTMFIGSIFQIVSTATVLRIGGLPFEDGLVGGAWAGFFGQMLVGLLGNLPISINAAAGPNLTVAYLLAKPAGLGSYSAAMTCCMLAGVLVAVLTLLGVISTVTNLVPASLKLSICVGIGLLCAFVGLQQIGMVVANDQGLIGPGDIVHTPEIWLTFSGIILLTLLNHRSVKGGVLITVLFLTLVDWTFINHWPSLAISSPKLPTVFAIEYECLGTAMFWYQMPAMSVMLVFDAMGCLFGLAKLAGRVDSETGKVEGGNGMFYAIGFGSTLSAICGVSPLVVNGTSAASILDGARTGLSTCVCAILYLALGLPMVNIFASLPLCTSSVILIHVGVSMSAECVHIAWNNPIEALPAFLCIICQPFLFSIADGIYIGLAATLVLSILQRLLNTMESFFSTLCVKHGKTLIEAIDKTPLIAPETQASPPAFTFLEAMTGAIDYVVTSPRAPRAVAVSEPVDGFALAGRIAYNGYRGGEDEVCNGRTRARSLSPRRGDVILFRRSCSAPPDDSTSPSMSRTESTRSIASRDDEIPA